MSTPPDPTAADPTPADDPGATAAAPGPSGFARLRSAFLHPSTGQAVVAVLVAAVAFAAVTQVRSNDANDTYAGLPQADLIQALNGLQAASRRAESEIDQLRRTRSRLRDSTERRAAAIAQAQKELDTLGVLAGTSAAAGPGIVITVHDPHGEYSVNHLLDGIEELRDAGAEAIQINGQVRVVAQTSFADADPGISVDGQVLNPPYTLDVIGDPDTLARALEFPGGFKDDVKLDEGTTGVRKSQHVVVDVTRSPSRPQYAEPTGSQ